MTSGTSLAVAGARPRLVRNGNEVHPIAQRILAYLEHHPHAADTAAGIRSWWLLGEPVSDADVKAALDWLVRHRLVTASDSRPPVYRLARAGDATH